MVIVAILPTAVVAWMLVAIAWLPAPGAANHQGLEDYLVKPELIPIWASLFVATVLCVVLRFLPKKQKTLRDKSGPRK
jgi:hypothetical protein